MFDLAIHLSTRMPEITRIEAKSASPQIYWVLISHRDGSKITIFTVSFNATESLATAWRNAAGISWEKGKENESVIS